jgi:hypothetical protein
VIGKKRARVILAEGEAFSELLLESIEAVALLFPRYPVCARPKTEFVPLFSPPWEPLCRMHES